MISKNVLCALVASLLLSTAIAQTSAPPAAGWPRHLALGDGAALLYPPQVVSWNGAALLFRSALALKAGAKADETFGTVEVNATTHVDKVSRMVALGDVMIVKLDVPALADRGASLKAQLAPAVARTVSMVSLDRLTASLAASRVAPSPVAVDNTPPRIIVATTPSILIPVDGPAVWKPVTGSPGFTRVINTRALILKSAAAPQVFMRVYDGWLMADSLAGRWEQPFLAPDGMDAVAKKIAATHVVDLLDGGRNAKVKPSLAQGVPTIYTSETPAEIVAFKGNPEFAPIVGTSLSWASNTTSDMLRDAGGNYYVLLAGRWFRASALTGPWTFVASDALPADFARIPPTSLAGAVLAAVAGTTEAREAVAENSVPQTATVPRQNGPAFSAKFDGAPQFASEPGTSLMRATNASVPIVRAADGYYAVKAGIWFSATQPAGPWSIATSVPAAIYSIPATSPIHFVTFVRIYGATPKAVFEGYTPGYLGALTTRGGTVVYGTGYNYKPWIGSAWYPAPATYGLAAAPVFNPRVGYTYSFAVGLATAEWSLPYFGGARFHPGYWGSYPCCGSASANVYRAWFKPPKAKTKKSKPAAPPAATTIAMTPQAPPPAFNPAAASALANSGPQVPIRHMGPQRGYDMSMVGNADGANPGAVPAAVPGAPTYISANEYYATLAKNGGWDPASANNDTYADASGKVYRNRPDGWQQHTSSGWSAAPAPPEVVAEAQSRSSVDPGMQAASYGMSNTTRFSGQAGDGWSRRDAGDGGYSRTLGGDGGISAEYNAYNDAVLNNEFDIAANGGWWGDSTYIGGVGWSGRLGSD